MPAPPTQNLAAAGHRAYIPQGYAGIYRWPGGVHPSRLATSGMAPCVGLYMYRAVSNTVCVAHFDDDYTNTAGEIIAELLTDFIAIGGGMPTSTGTVLGTQSNIMNPNLEPAMAAALTAFVPGVVPVRWTAPGGLGTDFHVSANTGNVRLYNENYGPATANIMAHGLGAGGNKNAFNNPAVFAHCNLPIGLRLYFLGNLGSTRITQVKFR